MKTKKVIMGAAMMMVASGGLTAATAGPAFADPGTCGVRNFQGPGSNPLVTNYIVRNKCSRTVNMKIKAGGRWLHCKPAPANGYVGWTTIYSDPNWSIGYC